MSRARNERERYILPARFDDTEIPGLLPAIQYVSLREKSAEALTDLICEDPGPERGNHSVGSIKEGSVSNQTHAHVRPAQADDQSYIERSKGVTKTRHASRRTAPRDDISIEAVAATLGHSDRRTTERFYNHARCVAGSRAVAEAMDGMMAGLVADHDTECFALRRSKKPAEPCGGAGCAVVVEVRRLELLTPYMRSKCSTS